MFLATIQNWLAERGYGQYALPRGRPRRRRMSSNGVILRRGIGTLGLFGVIAFGAMTMAMGFLIMAFLSSVFSGGAPTIR